MDLGLHSSVIVVAGATGGLGRAVTAALLREGATVIALYRSEAPFQTLAAAVHGQDRGRLEGRQLDVNDAVAVGTVVEGVLAGHARIDALVDCVGGYAGGTRLWELEPAGLGRMLELNVHPLLALCRPIVPILLRQRRGSIVNVAAKAAVAPAAGASAYAASKAAALALMQSLAAELTGTGVRVNSVLPSVIDTPANRSAMPRADFAKWPSPEALAAVIAFLCSDAAGAVHGAAIPVYGNQ